MYAPQGEGGGGGGGGAAGGTRPHNGWTCAAKP